MVNLMGGHPMLSLELDDETEKYLVEIMSIEQITSRELMKEILLDRWTLTKSRQTFFGRLWKQLT